MTASRRIGVVSLSACLLLAIALAFGRAEAAPDTTTITYTAGTACSFPLQVDVTGSPQVSRMFEGPDGTLRFLSAGVGSDLVFTNLDTGATYSLTGNGSVSWARVDASGSAIFTLTGHNVVIYFPTDDPAGPSTTLVVGREAINVDLTTSRFTRISRTGNTTDICAALN